MGKVNLITQAQYAKHRGVSEAAVSKAVKVGRISLIDGKIDPVAADAQWARNSRVRAGAGKPVMEVPVVDPDDDGGDSRPGAEDYLVSRARREAAEADLAELDLAERNGQVIAVKAVEGAWAQALSAAREHLLQVRSRLAPLLAAESDPFKVDQMLDVEMSQALAHLAGVRLQRPEEAKP